MMSEFKRESSSTMENVEVSVSGDTMQIDQTNVIVNIDEDLFNQHEPHSKDI